MLLAYSMLSSMTTTLILGISFIFLSIQSKKLYMRQWGICWIVYSCVFLMDFFNLYFEDTWPQYLSMRQSLLIVVSLLFLSGTCRFFQIKIPRTATVAASFLMLLSVISIYANHLYSFIIVPDMIGIASLLIASGCMFISYSWTQNLPEKIAASFLIILWAFFINHFGFTISHVTLAIVIYYIGIAIVTILMLLLMIIHFKKSQFLDNKQTARFRLLVENLSNCVFLFDYRKRAFEYVSPEINKVIGISSKVLYDAPERFFDHLEASKSHQKVFSIFSSPVKKPEHAILSLIRRGQVVRWSEMHYLPIFDDMGNVTLVEGIIRDITQEKLAEEKLRETEKAKEDFVENITHEIRTPITLIMGYTESILKDVIPPGSSKTYLNMILSKAVILNSLLDDLKQVSSFTSQNFEYKFYEVSAVKFFKNAIEQCQYHVEQSFHTFSSSMTLPDDIIVIIDQKRIMQAISNLINNAVRYTPPGKLISIECIVEPTTDDAPLEDNLDNTLPDGMVAFKVLDSGAGIDAKDMPYIFQRGYSSNKKNPEKKTSSGLGLYISQQILSQHSGQLSATNQTCGGACFTMYLPYYK